MGDIIELTLGRTSNPARSNVQAGNARLINCFAEELLGEGKALWNITGAGGLVTFGSALSGGGIRALLAIDDQRLLAVAGRNVYLLTPAGTATLVGGIPTDGSVYMERNRRVPVQVGIVSDGYYAVFDTSSVIQVQDPDLPPPTSFAYLDGFGVLPISRGRYMITSIDDFTQIDGLDEGATQSNPDEIVRALRLEREMFFFGSESLEAHQNTGDADFPLERNATSEIGCLAGDSVVRVDTPQGKTICWVANDHTVRMLNGYRGVVVSSNEIEDLIRRLDEAGQTDQLKATSWSSSGRFFYALSSDSWTRVFDAKTAFWHDRKSNLSDKWRVSKVVSFAGKTIAGDATTGQLYEMRDDVFDEAGQANTFEIITPPIHAGPHKMTHNKLWVDVAAGVGLNTATTADLDPIMLVDWSNDGGKSWSPARRVPLGRLGRDQTRAKISQLGSTIHTGRSYRFRISAAVEKLIMSAHLDVDKRAA